MFRPDQIEVGILPAERGQQVHSIAPLDLQRIKKKVKKAVSCEDQEDSCRLSGQQRKRKSQQKTEKKTRLGCKVKTCLIGI
jgi:hypothetical protein